MASEVEICNRALQKLGARRIVDFTENSVNSRSVSQAYSIVRDRELRAHPWNFAIRRDQLAASSTAPDFGKTNAFPLPSDFLALLPRDPLDNLNDKDWQIEGRELLTDEDAPFNLRYIAQIEDCNTMDPLFREALACAIAMEICEEITQSNTKKADIKDDYRNAIREARRRNAIENIPVEAPEDTLITVRA